MSCQYVPKAKIKIVERINTRIVACTARVLVAPSTSPFHSVPDRIFSFRGNAWLGNEFQAILIKLESLEAIRLLRVGSQRYIHYRVWSMTCCKPDISYVDRGTCNIQTRVSTSSSLETSDDEKLIRGTLCKIYYQSVSNPRSLYRKLLFSINRHLQKFFSSD